MKLEFRLLVVDDSPDGVKTAIDALRDYLDTVGFALKLQFVHDYSEKEVRELARSQGKNYDLVMVDYNLGLDDRDGAVVARDLRLELPYVDMVFYSSNPVSTLLKHLSEHEVSGVFAEERVNLDKALTGLADTVIGKVVDLNHMRGIAMAEVAEMDVLMEQTLVRVFQSNHPGINNAKSRTIKKIKRKHEDVKKVSGLLGSRSDSDELSDVVRDGRLFSLVDKYRAIMRVSKILPGDRPELEILTSYEKDIIWNRNMLAHVAESSTEDGKAILRSISYDGSGVAIDDDWMSTFRQKLQQHMAALKAVCEILVENFGSVGTAHDSKEREP